MQKLKVSRERISTEVKPDLIVKSTWHIEISSSISVGVAEILQREPNLESITLSVSDQAFIHHGMFKGLHEKKISTRGDIVTCTYEETIGTPVMFKKKICISFSATWKRRSKYILQ